MFTTFSLKLTRQHVFRILCLCASMVAGLLLSEVFLQLLLPKHYYIWQPHLEILYKPDENIMPGISGPSRFAVNSLGLRADEPVSSDKYRILAIGGSTTECLYLDQYEAWPYLLQKTLTEKASQKVWVGNAGMSGRTTRHHLIALQYLPLREMRIDVVILLIGVNDFLSRLREGEHYDPNLLAKPEARTILFDDTFTAGERLVRIDSSDSFFERTALWQMMRKAKRWASLNTSKGNIQDQVGMSYVTWRKHRQQAKEIRNELPDLSSALSEYTRNVYQMIDMAKEKGVRLILVTQPTMWKSSLPKTLEGLLWLGGVGNFMNESGKVYYSAEALQKGIDKYNNTLIEICEERQVECIDLSSMLAKDTTVFYDDDHFNESGAQMVSTILSEFILNKDLFKMSTFASRLSS